MHKRRSGGSSWIGKVCCEIDVDEELWPVLILGIIEFVQETASRGLTLVYEKGDKEMKVKMAILDTSG